MIFMLENCNNTRIDFRVVSIMSDKTNEFRKYNLENENNMYTKHSRDI